MQLLNQTLDSLSTAINTQTDSSSITGTKINPLYKKMELFNVPTKYQGANLSEFDGEFIGRIKAGVGDTDGYFITGPTGTGKTHLACAILKRWVAIGRANKLDPAFYNPTYRTLAWFYSVPELIKDIKADMDYKKGPKAIERAMGFKAVVLDDLGSELSTEWAIATLEMILARRVNWQFPTVVTSNKTLDEIQVFDPRMRSRLGSLEIITLVGDDRRDKSKGGSNGS